AAAARTGCASRADAVGYRAHSERVRGGRRRARRCRALAWPGGDQPLVRARGECPADPRSPAVGVVGTAYPRMALGGIGSRRRSGGRLVRAPAHPALSVVLMTPPAFCTHNANWERSQTTLWVQNAVGTRWGRGGVARSRIRRGSAATPGGVRRSGHIRWPPARWASR